MKNKMKLDIMQYGDARSVSKLIKNLNSFGSKLASTESYPSSRHDNISFSKTNLTENTNDL